MPRRRWNRSAAVFATVTVVDQESDGAAAAAVARAFPWAVILERRTNDGFATGINAGAARGTPLSSCC